MQHGITHLDDRLTAQCEVHQDFSKQENIFQMVQGCPCASTRITAKCRDVPQSGTCRLLACRKQLPIARAARDNYRACGFCSETGNLMAVDIRQLRHYVLIKAKCNSIAAMSVTHTVVMCGWIAVLTPLWKVTISYISASNFCVHFWTTSWLVSSSSNVVLQERHITTISARLIAPTFEGRGFKLTRYALATLQKISLYYAWSLKLF